MTEILSDDAVAFVADLNRRFRPRRNELLAARAQRRAEILPRADLHVARTLRQVREWPRLVANFMGRA